MAPEGKLSTCLSRWNFQKGLVFGAQQQRSECSRDGSRGRRRDDNVLANATADFRRR